MSPRASGGLVALLLAFAAAAGCGGGEQKARIVFTSERDGDSDIYVMDDDGSAVQQLTDSAGRDYEADSSPDGARLVFANQPANEDRGQLFLMNSDGSGLRPLTSPDGGDFRDDYPHWSPDGRRVVFQRTRLGEENDADIWMIDTQTGEETQLTDTPDAWDSTPSFDAGGDAVLFESDRSGNFDIYRLDLQDMRLVQLTDDKGVDSQAKPSPDGRQIAFVSDRDGDSEIYVMNSDGSNVRTLTANDAVDRCPQWSPDGRRIAFYSDRDGDAEIYVMNSDGSEQRRLTNSPGTDRVPDWLPRR